MHWSIALLDLHARDDQFQDDAAFGALAAELRAAGHEVSLVRSVMASAPGGTEAWHARIAEFLRQRPFDLAVLARAWDEKTVAVVRDALGEHALVVRFTSGVRAALDASFDHVLDREGLGRLLEGRTAPEQARLRRLRPAELRRRARQAAGRLGVVAPLGLEHGKTAHPGTRPTLSGPVPGCPFLLDSTKNRFFAPLDMNPDVVQTKGCTFCLDNTGSFAVPSESAVLDSWLGKLRMLHAADPELREVLLIDERPHPCLPAFFRALLADPALPQVELLFKSRVDWLLEFADTAIAEAAALAADHGSVLHLYLVGFESFDQFHLDLFNKGVTVADNIRAIEKMRELGERFPRSFEFRRYRAHGIVLFTPWTTPESLLQNARVMRDVDFAELRSEAVRTRLRLYPRVPLHALAERDGLLAASFSDGRPDRAAEQGYDASVPWRFQHPEMEAIYQVACGIGRTHSLGDDTLLELAVRYVRRHPGLSAEPAIARLPLVQAVRSWGSPASPSGLSVDTTLLGVDLEVELVARGAKQACLKEGVPRDDAADLCRAYRRMGLEADIVEWHGLERGRDVHKPGEDFACVAVAANRSTLDEVLACQRGHASAETVARMGALMGYPPCCVEAFMTQRVRGDNLDNERLTFRRAPAEALHPLVHRVGAVRLLSHHPCSPSCAGSIRIGEQILKALSSIDEAAAERVMERMKRPVLLLDYRRRLELAGAWEGERFRVDSAVVLGEPRHLDIQAEAVGALELGRNGVRFTLHDGSGVDVHAQFPLLTAPGQALAAPALDAIGGPIQAAPAPAAEVAPERAPALPAAIRKGVRVDEYRIESIAVRGVAQEIVLAGPQHSFRVRVRAHDPARPFTIRRGTLALDIDRAEELPVLARVALGVLVRALPRS